MKQLIEQGQIIKRTDAQSVSYMLRAPGLFFETGYKVLKSQTSGFVPSYHVLHNGMDKLVYSTVAMTPLDTLLPTLRQGVFQLVLVNLLDALKNVASIGFVHRANTEMTLNHIYVNPQTCGVFLVNLPLNLVPTPGEETAFETLLKRNILMAMCNYPNLQGPNFAVLQNALNDSAANFESIRPLLQPEQNITSPVTENTLTSSFEEEQQKPPEQKSGKLFGLFGKRRQPKTAKTAAPQALPQQLEYDEDGDTEALEIFAPKLVLVGVKTPQKVDMLIDKPEFTVGKKQGMVDGLLDFNPAISRMHCRIVTESGRSFLEDMGSANGTILNKRRLEANQKMEIKHGDTVQLANSRFIVKEV